MRKVQKRKSGKIFLAAVLVVLLAAGGIFLRARQAERRAEEERLATALVDLRGKDATEEDLAAAREQYPNAEILWDIRVGDRTFDPGVKSIVTGDLTAGDIGALQRFAQLADVDVSAVSDMDAVLAIRAALPGVNVHWSVPAGGVNWDGDARSISVSGLTAEELSAALIRLPRTERVVLRNHSLTPAEQLSLVSSWPGVAFEWDVNLPGVTVAQNARAVDWTGQTVTEADLSALEEARGLLPELEEVDLVGSGLDEDVLMDFADRHPELCVVWDRELFGVTFTTGDTELTFDEIPLTVEDAAQIEALLPYMPRLEKVNMCRCGIANEDMDALNRRHEDVRFVWMVNVYGYGVRTDQTYFTIYNCPLLWPENRSLADELRYCPDMVAIDLGHMHLFGDTSFFTCMPHLRYLIISNGAHAQIPELASLHELEWLEAHKSSLEDLKPLLECTALRHLNLAYIRIRTEEQRQEDVDVLSQMTWLERLWIGGNMFHADQVEALRQALPDTQIEIMYGEDTVIGGWRSPRAYFDMRDAMHMYYMNDKGHMVVYNPYTGERSQYEWTNPF